MKKTLIFMFLCVVIMGFVFSNNSAISKSTFDAYKQNSVKAANNIDITQLNCGDKVIYSDLVCDYVSTSVYSTSYIKLNEFIKNYDLKLVRTYMVEDTKVDEYYSPYFECNGDYNFQVANYSENYIIGYPYIFEGF